MITAAQCRAARALLNWDVPTLAAAASVVAMAIHAFEGGQSKPRPATLVKLRAALESGGVAFNGVDCCIRAPRAGGVIITGQQCRAARALLGWDFVDLAMAASVAVMTAQMFELGLSRASQVTLGKLRRAFEVAGVEFYAENDGCLGVRLRKPTE